MSGGGSSGSSGPGSGSGTAVPGPGTTVTLRVCAVGLRPEVPVVQLWGVLGERGADYVRLRQEIQEAVGPRLAAGPGGVVADGAELCTGDVGLVEIVGLWYRCCVVNRRGQDYRVFLLDEGCTVVTSACYLARGCKELFRLPPEVLGCVVANVMPAGGPGLSVCGDAPGSTWTVEAMEFLSHLHGKEVSGQVQEVITPQLIVLELPQLVAQMNHLGLVMRVTPGWFCQVLKCCLTGNHLRNQAKLQPPACSLVSSAVPQLLHVLHLYQPVLRALDYFYPQLQLGVAEPVLVTHVTDPHRIYCQLQSLSQEIRCLSDTMCHTYHHWEQEVLPEVGSPCAARGRDGQWYRALLLDLPAGEQDQQVALVIFVDYGRKETVTKADLRHLPVECFRMPVVTYPCALQGISDRGCGWSLSQIEELKRLVLGKRVSACLETFNSFERLYYVTLYGENGSNLNHLFGVQACCLVSSHTEVSPTEAQKQPKVEESRAEELELPPRAPPFALMCKDLSPAPGLGVCLKLGVFHDVQVSHLQDPSEFWLQLHEHRLLFRQLRQSMWNFYSHATNLDGGGWDLQPGSLCCASGKEGVFYRAVITRVLERGVEIHLVDRGNTETVDQCAVKELLPQFMELPALALKCSLAGVSPLRGSWSELSVSAFREMVLNKGLNIHFFSAQDDKYMVEIFDESRIGEKSVNKLMALLGYAEYQRCEIPETLQKSSDTAVSQASSLACAGEENQLNTVKRLREESGQERNDRALNPSSVVVVRESPFAPIHSSNSSESLPVQKYVGKENLPISWRQNYVAKKQSFFYGSQLEVGSTVNVVVTCVENPSYFWCQLSRNCDDLKELMAKIQEYCKKSSHPCSWPNSVCLAQYSEDEKWYRAFIISEVFSAGKVEVLYVDYGNRELVSLGNLRSAEDSFLRLEPQAFRCSLYNFIQPNGQDPFAWDEEAIQTFQEFVNSSSLFELKCTIFALASINNNELFNIVDLMTPFQSACQFLTDKGVARPLSPQKPLVSSVQLHSYYYSTHGIKIGNEEDVYITHVEDPWTFYCQLERCADVLVQLNENISRLSETMTSLGTLHKSGSLCLAKYTDNHWYRGLIKKTKPHTEVFFVDFGNTETIEEDHLLPLPSDAYDILLLPMQAIKCSLPDISNVPKEATAWFKQAVLERQLKAIVVAKESDGKLLIELFDANTQFNAKLKEKLNLINNAELCRHVENETLGTRNTDVNERNETAESPLNAGRPLEREECISGTQGGGRSSKRHLKEDVNFLQPATEGEVAAAFVEFDKILGSEKDAFLLQKAEEESLFSIQMSTESDNKSDAEGGSVMLKNLSCLLQQKIVPGLKSLVYVSHVNDPLDFYVQLGSDEAQLNSISESLNDKAQAKNPCGQLFQAGDLISAVYSEDSLWYRAVVKEKISGSLISIQYIDYGNTSLINVDQACRLPEDLSFIPAISIHCLLRGLKWKKNADWAEKAVLYFTKRTSEILLTCEFVEKVEDKWEVILSDHEGIITVDVADENLARPCSTEILDRMETSDMITVCEISPSQSQTKISCVSDCKLFTWKLPEAGQIVKIYVTVVDGPEYFWSCSADTEGMNYIESKIEEAENLGLNSWDDCRSCIKSGDFCLAKYSQDGKFYRAKVISIKGDNVVVRHVDYGSEEAVSMEMVRQIPCELLKIPYQAFPCCLSDFKSSEGSWLSEAKDKFYDITKNLLLEAEVIEILEDKASEIGLSVVKLESSGKSINEEMKSFWKASKGTGGNSFSDFGSPLKEKRYSNNDAGLCLEREATAVGALAQEESESALLGSELLGVTSECLNTAKADVAVGAAEGVSGEAEDGCETAEHHSSFDKEGSVAEGESDNTLLAEPLRSCSPPILRSEMKATEQESSKVLFQEDSELKAELPSRASAANLFLGNNQQELQRLPVLQVQSLSDETGKSVELNQLQMQSSFEEFIMGIEALSLPSSYSEETKEALETESLDVQTVFSSKAREVLNQESLELPDVSGETGVLEALKFLKVLPSLNEKQNLVPSDSGGEKAAELIPPDVQLALGEKEKSLELDLSGIHKAEAVQEDWMEVEPAALSSSGGRPEKQDLKPHGMLLMLGNEIDQLLERLLPDTQPSQEDGEEDFLGLEHTALQSSANSGSRFPFLTEHLTNQRTVCTVKSCDCKAEKHQEWQKQKDFGYVEEWIKQGFTETFEGCVSVQSSECNPGDEEGEKKQNENLAECGAEHEYTCHLKGFAVGSKCVVWSSLKWCEARILEISEKGTRVLNFSSGSEELVDPENVWNGIPDWAGRSSEATPPTENLQSLPDEPLLQEEQVGCSSNSGEEIILSSTTPETQVTGSLHEADQS